VSTVQSVTRKFLLTSESVVYAFIMNAGDQGTSLNYRTCVYPVPRVPLRIDLSKPIDGGVKQLLQLIRPEWPIENIRFKVMFFSFTYVAYILVVSAIVN